MTYFLLEHNPGRITFNNLTWKYHIDAITAKISIIINYWTNFKTSALHTWSYTVIYLPNINPPSPKLWSCCLGSGIQDFPSCFGVKLWNEIPCHIRDLPKKKFTKVLHRLLSDILKREDDYIETSLIVEKVRLTVK